jgi:hypothetical protein
MIARIPEFDPGIFPFDQSKKSIVPYSFSGIPSPRLMQFDCISAA